jgi:predicted dinucleotide-binding enzyme
MKVGIIGSGQVARALGTAFATLEHEVRLGTREPDKLKEWVAKTGAKASTGTNEDVARFGEIVLVVTGWSGTESALRLAGPRNVAGKVVIDVTNPLATTSAGGISLAVGFDESAGELVQRWLPDARVVKAFNIITHSQMFRPKYQGGPPTMFICGNDEAAKQTVVGICRDFGWPETVDIGGIEGARLLEPLGMLWIQYGVRTGKWDHAFKLIHQ